MRCVEGGRLLAVAALIIAVALPVVADWEKGQTALNAKDYASAEKEFQEVIETNPEHPGGYYMRGLAQRGMKQTSKALASFRKAAELGGADPTYQITLGQTLVADEQYGEAYSVLQPITAESLKSNVRSTYALLFARAATKTNRSGEAVQALRAQLGNDPGNSSLHQALGVAYDAEGNDTRAFESFKKAYELNSKDQGSGRSAVYAAITAARRATGSSDKGRYYSEAARLAEKLAATSSTFEHNLLAGEAWLGAGEYSKALTWFDKAGAQQPQNSLVHFYRGQCHSSLKKWNSALSELQRALDIGVSGKLRKNLYNQLGFVYDNMKDYPNAAAAYQEAGNTAKRDEMASKQGKADQNKAADAEMEEFRRKLAALELQIEELDKLGEVDEASQLREQLDELRKALNR